MSTRGKAGLGIAALALLAAGFFFIRKPVVLPPPPPSPAFSGPVIVQNDMLKVADKKVGAEIFKMCASCHSNVPEGAPGKVGPILFGVVGRGIASRGDYEYSDSLLQMRGRIWNTDELDKWLHDPSDYAPRNKMRFGGILDPQDRWDLIAYLISLR